MPTPRKGMEDNMPARKRKIRHDEETRAKIQAAQLINRMFKCAMGEVEMDNAQVSCAKALLSKVLPDLKAMELQGAGEDGEHTILFKTIIEK